jgi:hypothetical protein
MLPAHVFLRTPRARFVEHHGGTLGCSARGHTGPPETVVLLTLACAPDRRLPPPSPRLPRCHPLAPPGRSDRGTVCTNNSDRCEKLPYEDLIRSRTRLLQEIIERVQTLNNNLREVGVLESKRNTIRRGLVHELLNAQDTVLCSYFAQRSGARGKGRGRESTVGEALQGLDYLE